MLAVIRYLPKTRTALIALFLCCHCASAPVSASTTLTPELIVQTGHNGSVDSVAYSPDGRLIASGGWDATVKIWDVATNRELRSLVGHKERVTSLAFSPDGRMLASGSGDCTLKIWDVFTGRELKTFTGPKKKIESVAFGRDSRTLISGSADRTIRVWEIATSREVKSFAASKDQDDPALVDYEDFPTQLALSPDGKSLAFAKQLKSGGTLNGTGALQFLDFTSSSEGRTVALKKSWVTSVAYSSDGRTVATGIKGWSGQFCCKGWIKIWDASSGLELHTMEGYSDNVMVAFSPDGRTLASGGTDQAVRFWDVATGREVRKFQPAEHPSIYDLTFSPDGRTLAAACEDASIRLIEVANGRELSALRAHHSGDVTSVVFSPDGRTLATAVGDKVKIWNLEDGRDLRNLTGFGNQVWKIAFSPDGKTLAAGTSYTTIRLKDAATGRDLGMIADHGRSTSAIAFNHNGRTLASTNDDNVIRLWDIKNAKPYCDRYPCNEELRVLSNDNVSHSIFCVEFSPDGRLLASGGVDAAIDLWNVRTGRLLKSLKGHKQSFKPYGYLTGNISALSFSPDSRTLASGGLDNKVILWDVASGRQLRTLSGHEGRITELRFSPDGRTLASASEDRTVRIWDTSSGTEAQKLSGHANTVFSVAFSPNGRVLASGSSDTTVKLWNPENGRLLGTLFALEDSDWVVADPFGRFDANKLDEIKDVSWLFPDEPLRALAPEVFMRDYYQPVLLPRLYRLEEMPPLRPVSEINRTLPAVKLLKAESEGNGLVSVTVEVADTESEGQKDASGRPLRSGAYDLRLFRNHKLVGEWPDSGESHKTYSATTESEIDKWRSVHRIDLLQGTSRRTFSHIKLPQSSNSLPIEFTAYAFNSDRVKSQTTAPLAYTDPGSAVNRKLTRRAYVISMGVDANQSRWNLELAVTSANRVRRLLAARLKGEYEQVVEIPLSSELADDGLQLKSTKARKADLEGVLNLLAGRPVDPKLRDEVDPDHSLAPAGPDDAVVLYIASHGYADSQGNFFVIPYDTGSNWGITTEVLRACPGSVVRASAKCKEAVDFLQHAISSSDLADWWRGIDAGEMIMILDSCHAGAVSGKEFRPGPLGDPGFGQLSYDKGMRVLCAAQPAQNALGQWIGGGAGRTLLVETLEQIAKAEPNAGISEWLKRTRDQMPVIIKRLYPDMPAHLVQTPELFDFVRTQSKAQPISEK